MHKASKLLAIMLLVPAIVWAQSSGPNTGSGSGSSSGSTTWTSQSTTGTDTVSFSGADGANQIWTIGSNEAFTLSDSRTASTTTRLRDQLMVCQNATGNFTLTFSGSIVWCNGAAAPDYPLTASGAGANCQTYQFDWNGTNLICVGETVPFAGP